MCLFVIGFWAFVAGIQIGNHAVIYTRLGRTIPWLPLVAANAVEWASWALMTPLLFAVVRWWPLTTRPRLPTIAIYGTAAVASVLFHVAVSTGSRAVLGQFQPAIAFREGWAYDLLLFIWVVLALHAVVYYGEARQRELEAARLQSQLATARLEVLTMQVRPHFLFNTLNTISGLITLEPRRADRMISRLGDLLRFSLSGSCESVVTLQEELELLDAYLEIQQTRFDERLVVERDIDSRAHAASVPAFLLQQIVENTIRHAVAPYSAPVHVTIAAQRIDDGLRLVVKDDGPGLPVEEPNLLHEGVGLRNTRVRLEQLYGSRQRFQIRSGRECGVEVVIELPWDIVMPAEEPRHEATSA